MNIDRENYLSTAKELINFLEKSPICFHAIQSITDCLEKAGFTQLHEGGKWEFTGGGSYFVTRNGSSIVSFKVLGEAFPSFQIMASHSDSSSFKIKENPEIEAENRYIKLNVEKHDGMLCAPWFDRPLSVAGRLAVKEGNRIATKLVKVDRDLLMIPNLAIHFNREINDGYKCNAQVDMLPLYGGADTEGTFTETAAESAGIRREDILGHDLYLYNYVPGSIWGASGEFLSCGRLDDLQCVFSTLKGFLEGGHPDCVSVHVVFDNEEIGSLTKQGADSTFLEDVLGRINSAMRGSREEYLMAIASSFMASADNAHAAHPNHGDKSNPVNRPYMNEGIAIKYNTKYATDELSAAVFRTMCQEEEIPCQAFTNRSDKAGGPTLGNISNSHAALNTVDIGLPRLSMYSPCETAGVKGTYYLIRVAKRFYSASMRAMGSGSYEMRQQLCATDMRQQISSHSPERKKGLRESWLGICWNDENLLER